MQSTLYPVGAAVVARVASHGPVTLGHGGITWAIAGSDRRGLRRVLSQHLHLLVLTLGVLRIP